MNHDLAIWGMPRATSSPAAAPLPKTNASSPLTLEPRRPTLDELSLKFAIAARAGRYMSLDLGCGEGVATVAALARGARMMAIDADPANLQRLLARVPFEQRRRLNAHTGALPELDFVFSHFSAVHAARAFHLLDPESFTLSLRKFFRWLYPHGKLFISTLAPGGARWKTLQKEIGRRRLANETWPGFIANAHEYFPDWSESAPSVHLIDEEVLRRELASAGFLIDEASCYSPIWDARQEYCSIVAHCDA